MFDGYGNGPSTKDHEHERRAKVTAPDIQVSESLPIYNNQSTFLSNSNNKKQFIDLLHKYLVDAGHTVIQAVSDADTDIVKAALYHLNLGLVTTVVADDTDVLVLLVYHFKPAMGDAFMLRSASGKKKVSRLVDIRKVQDDIGIVAVHQLLVTHALSGCDTTSAIFGHGKVGVFQKIKSNKESLHLTDVLSMDNVSYTRGRCCRFTTASYVVWGKNK